MTTTPPMNTALSSRSPETSHVETVIEGMEPEGWVDFSADADHDQSRRCSPPPRHTTLSAVADDRREALSVNHAWDSIRGVDAAKTVLLEAIILPLKFPALFANSRRRCSSVLLYGPSGAGKSALALAAADKAGVPLVCAGPADLASPDAIQKMFLHARERKPAVLLLNDVDQIWSGLAEGGNRSHESLLQLRTELLVQMDSFSARNVGLYVVGLTTLPWNLEGPIRKRCADDRLAIQRCHLICVSRFHHRLYIPRPDQVAKECFHERLPLESVHSSEGSGVSPALTEAFSSHEQLKRSVQEAKSTIDQESLSTENRLLNEMRLSSGVLSEQDRSKYETWTTDFGIHGGG
ncbi:unnamed protein product [Mycena citricolor]|uniref:AAA+ ATPase domain-containing protein n=1 Tax=Mycena citricolor TaxID=2018698 RepID=A0AAD2K4E1_9AGAR|nr:unnamed protein product [Mycena citricolor]